jgi:hypothetical protein
LKAGKAEEVTVEDLVDDLMEAKMKIRKRRMRPVVVRVRGEIISIKIIEIKEEEDEDKDQEEEASVEHVFTVEKKVIGHMNVLNTKEGQIGEMMARLELHMWMKMQNHLILKMLKEEKS